MTKQLFIGWVPFQRRSVSMQAHFQYNLEFIRLSFKYRWMRPIEYLLKAQKTFQALFLYNPNLFWIQLPPNFLLHLAYLYKHLFSRELKIIADCHNATFRSPWIKIPGTVSLLNRCDLVIVHNQSVLKQALSLGIDPNRTRVLEDPPAKIVLPDSQLPYQLSHPLVVFPCSFNTDEPIQEVLESAKLAPDITFAMTGNSSRARGIHALTNLPANIKLTGFLSEDEFNSLLLEADLILGLTKLDGIQLSVANEAVGIGKPLVLSNTATLKSLFHRGAVFVDSSCPKAIINGCRDALAKLETLTTQVKDLRVSREEEWKQQASSILKDLVGEKQTPDY